MNYDVVIAGGGPAGLTAALILGRARKRVLLTDSGSPRNGRAERVHGFVTRDGTPPTEFRRLAREQLAAYPSVEIAGARVTGVTGEPEDLEVELEGRRVVARRVLLCLGMVDGLPEIPGFGPLWGRAIFQCPYCHAWEVRDRPFGYLASSPAWLEWPLLLTAWSRDLVVFTNGAFDVPSAARERLAAAGVELEERPIRSLVVANGGAPGGDRLQAVELADGARIAREVLFARARQRHTELVLGLGLALDDQGFVQIDEQMATSRPGIAAAGDLTTPHQSAQLAAAAGARAAYALNHVLTLEDALAGR